MDKKQLEKLKNLIKEEGGGSRLQSLRVPRDLSLGGTKPKKQYAPNLNVVRNKDKAKEFLKKLEQKRKDRSKHDKAGKSSNPNKPRYVQSSGVFSEGAGELKKASRSETRASFKDGDSSSPASMIVPTIKRNSWTVNKKAEDIVLDDLMGCEEESDDDEKSSFEPQTWRESDLKEVKVLPKRERDVKIEPIETDISKLELTNNFPKEFQDDKHCDDTNPTLMIWNLPDSFAGKGLSDDPTVKKIFDFPLHSMLEGTIGKICIRKSGKIEAHVGRVKYDLEPTELTSCTEQVNALDVKDNANLTAVAVLGQIQNRYLLNPDWDSLLD